MQLNRALRIWEEDRVEDFPLLDFAAQWLRANMPSVDHLSIVHGDDRSGNFLFDKETGQIGAWLDWERAHLGDRHRDLAWTTRMRFGHYSEDGSDYYICSLIPINEFYDRCSAAPALDPDDPLAREQLRLSVDCLSFVRRRLDDLHGRERLDLLHNIDLAQRLLGLGLPVPMAEALRQGLAPATPLAADPAARTAALRDCTVELAHVVAVTVQAAPGFDGQVASAMRRTVLDATGRKVGFERIWYAPIRFEPAPLDEARLAEFLKLTFVRPFPGSTSKHR